MTFHSPLLIPRLSSFLLSLYSSKALSDLIFQNLTYASFYILTKFMTPLVIQGSITVPILPSYCNMPALNFDQLVFKQFHKSDVDLPYHGCSQFTPEV